MWGCWVNVEFEPSGSHYPRCVSDISGALQSIAGNPRTIIGEPGRAWKELAVSKRGLEILIRSECVLIHIIWRTCYHPIFFFALLNYTSLGNADTSSISIRENPQLAVPKCCGQVF